MDRKQQWILSLPSKYRLIYNSSVQSVNTGKVNFIDLELYRRSTAGTNNRSLWTTFHYIEVVFMNNFSSYRGDLFQLYMASWRKGLPLITDIFAVVNNQEIQYLYCKFRKSPAKTRNWTSWILSKLTHLIGTLYVSPNLIIWNNVLPPLMTHFFTYFI